MGFLGVCSNLTQGVLVRKLLLRLRETRVLLLGLATSATGLVTIGFSPTPVFLYIGVGLLALGGGLINPASSGLISLYADEQEQGRVLGIFRSLGSLARAITPLCAGAIFWTLGAETIFSAGAALAVVAAWLALRLPQPRIG
jgi:MFS family permease